MKRWRAMCSACSILTFIVSSLLLLTLIIWIPQAAHATSLTSPRFQDKVQATSVQTTPTVDPTVTALQKEKLMHENDWWWNFGATLISTLALLGGGIFALIRWLGDRRAERDKQQETEKLVREDREAEREKRDEEQQRWLEDRTEERFQSVVEGLGSTVQAPQVGAAITLRTFLHPGYEQFYSQAFDLAVAHLRLRPLNPDEAQPLDSLSHALITIFGQQFPLP